jgi:uncharacterized Fe-S cluster protein YjdI
MKEVTKEYSNDDLTIVWDSGKCKHAAECVKNSPNVFYSKLKPWINLEGADSEQVMATIDKCPSGALTYRKK